MDSIEINNFKLHVPYRLGDMVRGCGDALGNTGGDAHIKQYPNSIVVKYFEKTKN